LAQYIQNDLINDSEYPLNIDNKIPVSIYHPLDKKKCACKGTGLIGNAPSQSYCPCHRIKRTWPQVQKDNSIQFIPLDIYNKSVYMKQF